MSPAFRASFSLSGNGSHACGGWEPIIGLALALSGESVGGSWSHDDKNECMLRALDGVGVHRVDNPVAFPSGGAPTVAGGCVLSLSHSGPWLLCAAVRASSSCATLRLGVDLEHNLPRGFEQIRGALGWPSACDDPSHFYRRWTLAESLFKAVGTEWRQLFDRFDHATGRTARRHESESNGLRWLVRWPQLVTGCTVCVVTGVAL